MRDGVSFAGGGTTLQLGRLTAMRILAAHDGGSGCAWYRMLTPLWELQAQYPDEFDITFRSYGNNSEKYGKGAHETLTARDFTGYDIVLGQRFQYMDGIGAIRRGITPKSRFVYEVDDDVFTITHENIQAWDLYSKESIREAVRGYLGLTNLVTVTTETLAERYRPYADRVLAIPNFVQQRVLMLPDTRLDRNRKIIGWAGGGSHGKDIMLATNGVRRFLKRHADWDLVLGGVDYRPAFKVPDDRVTYRPWKHVSDDPRGYYDSLDYDIGFCPLMDTEFGRAKTAIKALEYAARGIPCVASDVEPYNKFVEHGVTGFLAKRDHEWLKYLEELSDDDTRFEMGQAARGKAATMTIEKNVHLWADAYRSLFPR